MSHLILHERRHVSYLHVPFGPNFTRLYSLAWCWEASLLSYPELYYEALTARICQVLSPELPGGLHAG